MREKHLETLALKLETSEGGSLDAEECEVVLMVEQDLFLQSL